MKLRKDTAFKLLTQDIQNELVKSDLKHGDMPQNLFECMCIVNEEIGESNQAVLKMHYENGSTEDLRYELIQSAAMCYKMLLRIFPHEIIKND